MTIPQMSALAAEGKSPDVLFWVGCAGSFDARAQRVTKAMAQILEKCQINYAILGNEEMCTGDPARRAGNEFVFQMMANQNVQVLNNYGIKRIVTACPHCFNTIKNEYPALGGNYEVMHHTQFLQGLLDQGILKLEGEGSFKGKRITYHDSCYLGRVNGVYEVPRHLVMALDSDLVELKRSRQNGLCCGAGGAQMFKEDEKGDKRINTERIEEALEAKPDVIAANCPFCITMLSDGLKAKEKQDTVQVLDVSEMLLDAMN